MYSRAYEFQVLFVLRVIIFTLAVVDNEYQRTRESLQEVSKFEHAYVKHSHPSL